MLRMVARVSMIPEVLQPINYLVQDRLLAPLTKVKTGLAKSWAMILNGDLMTQYTVV